ncbi:MAG: cytochrome b5-like heme/steroid binding domain-containing protein [Actinomycetota bacterium]|nr:cytochrome b5-like heme/steroid binding domain-containing protein [Actinomycetota bacterium]
MKKSLAVLVFALVLSTVSAPGSSAAVKAGAACKKAGKTSTAAGKKFTCVKKSGKLIWKKGVKAKKRAKPSTTATTKPTTKPTTSTSTAPSAAATPAAKPTPAATPAAKPTPATTVAAGYTMAQVRANNGRAKCWTVISENVYDLTAWIGDHPGGAGAIVSLCGTDGTQGFLAMHRNQSKPESRLAGYLLGPLAK